MFLSLQLDVDMTHLPVTQLYSAFFAREHAFTVAALPLMMYAKLN